jgi:hypothetical protein
MLYTVCNTKITTGAFTLSIEELDVHNLPPSMGICQSTTAVPADPMRSQGASKGKYRPTKDPKEFMEQLHAGVC